MSVDRAAPTASAKSLWIAFSASSCAVVRFSAAEQKQYFDKVRPLGDELLGKHKNPEVRRMYGLFKQAAAATAK